MNIIEAIQAAESGILITNNFLKTNNQFLKYEQGGFFSLYELEYDEPVFKFVIGSFSMAEILSIGWQLYITMPDDKGYGTTNIN